MLLLCRKMQTTLLFILIYKLFICVEADEFSQVIQVKTEHLKHMKVESYAFINKIYYKVLPKRPLRIIFKDHYFTQIECRTYTYLYKVGEFGPGEILYNGQDSIIEINEVNDDMSDIWWCIFSDDNILKHIYFEIFVEGAKPGQMILVNNSILRIRKENDGYYRAEYYYGESEAVDLLCVSPKNNNCSIFIYKSNEVVNKLSSDFAYRLNLKSEDIRKMVCMCDGPKNHKTTLLVTFILQDKDEGVLKLTINGRTVKGFTERYNNKYNRYFNYAYFNKDILKVVCKKIQNNDYKLSYLYNFGSAVTAKWSTSNSLGFNVIPSNILLIRLSANGTQSGLYEEIIITFKQIKVYVNYTTSSTPKRATATTDTPRTSIFTTITTSSPPSVTTESLPTSSTTDAQSQELWWILVLICIIVIIMIICVSTCVYKMKKRFLFVRSGLNSNFDNLQGHDNSLIPCYPAQWESGFAAPKPEVNDKPDYVNSRSIYSNIAIKTQSESSSDNIYANCDDVRDRVQEGFHDEEACTYAQALPKSERNQIIYADIITNSVNSTIPKYDQPAYSEISFKDN